MSPTLALHPRSPPLPPSSLIVRGPPTKHTHSSPFGLSKSQQRQNWVATLSACGLDQIQGTYQAQSTCASALTRDRKTDHVRLTTLPACGLDQIHPGTHRVQKNMRARFCSREGQKTGPLRLLPATFGWLRSRPAASTKNTQVPIGYKAHVHFCSNERQKAGLWRLLPASLGGYALGLRPRPDTPGYPSSQESLRTPALARGGLTSPATRPHCKEFRGDLPRNPCMNPRSECPPPLHFTPDPPPSPRLP